MKVLVPCFFYFQWRRNFGQIDYRSVIRRTRSIRANDTVILDKTRINMLFLSFPVVMSDTLKDITFLIVLNKTTRFCDDIIFLVKSKQAILNCKPLKDVRALKFAEVHWMSLLKSTIIRTLYLPLASESSESEMINWAAGCVLFLNCFPFLPLPAI